MARGLTMAYSNGTTIFGLPDNYSYLGSGDLFGVSLPVIITAVVFLLAHLLLSSTVFGHEVYAVGGNREAAHLAGINVRRVELSVYMLAGALSGLAGVVLTGRLTAALPGSATGLELDVIAAVVIGGASLFGGRGNMIGTFFGVLTIGVLRNGLNLLNVSPFWVQFHPGRGHLRRRLARCPRSTPTPPRRGLKSPPQSKPPPPEPMIRTPQFLLLAATAIVTTAAFPLASTVRAADKKEIVTVVKVAGQPWFNRLELGVKQAKNDLGVDAYQVGATTTDEAAQVSLIDDSISKGVGALCVVPNDAKSVEPAFDRARAKGIVVITHESPNQKGRTSTSRPSITSPSPAT